MCLSTNYSSSWFGPTAHIRLYLDIVIGSTKPNAEHDRSHVTALVSKIRDLNIKIEDVRREQQYQREREADFRNLSEVTNSRALWYSVAQIVVLILTCTWQLQHLRVSTMVLLCLRSNVYHTCSISSDSLRIGRCASVQLHIIYMFQNTLYGYLGNCIYSSLPSTLRITFFLKLPNAILRNTSLIALEACSSLVPFSIVIISCFGSLNCSDIWHRILQRSERGRSPSPKPWPVRGLRQAWFVVHCWLCTTDLAKIHGS